MGKVTVVTKAEAESRSLARSSSPQAAAYRAAKYPVDKLPYFPLDGETLEMFHVQLGPDAVIEPHAHTDDEIIYLLRGAIHLGARVLGPGDALHVAGNTLYGFKVGPEGCEFLNFRPNNAVGLLTKEQFLANREGRA
jgi:quercetin dioxygenase-like cupin family protein